MNNPVKPDVTGFFDNGTNTISYIVKDPTSDACAIIDSVLDFDLASGRVHYDSANKLIEHIKTQGLSLQWLIETHAHADHLSAAPYIQKQLGGKIGIGEGITKVQAAFQEIFSLHHELNNDGSEFDKLFADQETYEIGNMPVTVISTPGHTPACMSHVVGDAIFVGDTIFMPDGGTARVDFPGGDAHILYASIQKILRYPEQTRIFICHDYGPNGREYAWKTSVGEIRRSSIHVSDEITEDQFVVIRTERDKQLSMPKLLIPSIQVNIRAGHLPEADAFGNQFLKVPINKL